MAYGQAQGGGLMGLPDVPSIGPQTWAEMSGIHPDSPLIGGRGVPTGGVDPDYKYRKVALGGATSAPHGGPHAARAQGHYSELMNFRHSPMPWILLGAIAYLGLVHLHVAGKVGPYKGSGGVG